MPSRPPLLSEQTPTTSGIVLDPQTGDRKVAPSKRPDGTLRKEIKIRPGYTPSEDVSKFRSARQQESDVKKLPKGSVIGMIRPQTVVAQSALKGMTEAQRKNAKRKEKRKTAKQDELEAPDQWDVSSTEGATTTKQCSSSKPLDSQDSSSESKQTNNPTNKLFESAIKSSSSNPSICPAQQLVLPTPQPIPQCSSSKQTEKPNKGKAGIKILKTALNDIDGALPKEDIDSIEKRTKALRKKLIQAEQLKARNEKGERLLPEQLDKISKIDELQLEISKLEITN